MAGFHRSVRLHTLDGLPGGVIAINCKRHQFIALLTSERGTAEDEHLARSASLAVVLARRWLAGRVRGFPGPTVRFRVEHANRVVAATPERHLLRRKRCDLAPLALDRRRPGHALIRPGVLEVHEERRSADGNDLLRLAEIVVSDVDAIPPRSGDRVVHLVDAVVLVHKADSPLGRARIALLRHLHDELVATGSTLGVARVLGEDEEGNFHAVLCGSRGVETGTKRETVLRRGVGEVPEPHFVDSPALIVDVETHFHLHGAEVFEVGSEAGDLCGVHEGTLGDHLVLPRLEAHLDLLRLLELHAMNSDLRLAEHRADVGRDVEHCVRRADDGAHVERPRVAEPSVRPPTKQEHLARLRIVRHRRVLSRDGGFANGHRCVPDHRSTIHDVHLVEVGVLALLSREAEHLVVGH